MNRQSLSKSRWGRSAVILALVITAGLGLCLFDGDHDHGGDHGMSQDLCAGLIAVTLGYTILVGPLLVGAALSWPGGVLVAVPVSVLDPPPKSSVPS